MPEGGNANNVWKALFQYYEKAKIDKHKKPIVRFMEAEAYMDGIVSPHSDWLKKRNSFKQFKHYYNESKSRLDKDPSKDEKPDYYIENGELRGALRRLLQMIYLRAYGYGNGQATEFPEIGYRGVGSVSEFENHVRPPKVTHK